jgi:hypothetical protein
MDQLGKLATSPFVAASESNQLIVSDADERRLATHGTIPNDSRALNCSALFVGEMEGSGFIPNSRFDPFQSRVDVFGKPRIF